jgi:DNA-binding transcriptional LysR family regulator
MQKTPSLPDWDDLRQVLAIARCGGLAGAAAALGVDHSTMFRRLNALERRLGAKLFERRSSGYRPTEAGLRVVGAAERIEAEALALDRDLTGRDARLEGRLRVTSSETLAFGMLTREIARFRTLHPGIVVELAIDNRPLDLARREADVALRATRPQEADLFGRKLAEMDWAVYGRRQSRTRLASLAELAGSPVIGWGSSAAPVRAAEWIAEMVPESAIVYRSNSLINQLVAAKAGLGLAVLPCYLADPEPALRRLMPPIPDLARELWIVTHRDLKETARVRTFMEVVGEGIRLQFRAPAPGSKPG